MIINVTNPIATPTIFPTYGGHAIQQGRQQQQQHPLG